SGSEIFAAAVQGRKRGLIICARPPTCGCLLGVSRKLKLWGGGKLEVSDTHYSTGMGRPIGGAGGTPDLQVETRMEDLLSSRDRTLELAADQLGRTIAFGSRSGDIEFKLNVPNIGLRSSIRNSPTSQSRR